MQNGPFGRSRPAPGRCLRARSLRRASLLIGTSFLLHAVPALAANECGPPPPGGGTVTCPAGNYPNGIRYTTIDDIEVVLQPGVTVFNGTSVQSSGDLRFVGPTDTSLNQTSSVFPQTAALRLLSGGTTFADVDDVFSSVDDLPAVSLISIGPLTFFADTVKTAAIRATAVDVVQGDVGPPTPGQQAGINVRVNAITTTGGGSGGISASSSQRDVHVSAGSITISGSGTGISVSATNFPLRGLTAFVDAQTIQTVGPFSRGIVVSANNTKIESGTIITGADRSGGIHATTTEDISIRSKRIDTAGSASPGIVAISELGAVTIDSGKISTAGTDSQGIFAVGLIDADITVRSATVTTAGATSSGISASGASVVIDSAAISTAGDGSRGISTFASGGTDIASTTISTLGADAAGIFAQSPSGDIRVVSGAITTQGPRSAGIQVASPTRAVNVTATDVGVVGAQSDAIVVTSGTGSQVTVLGLVQSQQGLAVQAELGAAVLGIAATGTVRGRVDLTGNADRVNNGGLFDALGTSEFGAGSDLFANLSGGTLRSLNGAAVMAGLESFTNQGLIEMRDGAVGDSVTLTGAYSGLSGGRLGLDVNFATSTADRLVTGAATGSTLIDLRTSGSASGLGSILLVDAGAGTSPTAFGLGSGAVVSPYLVTRIRFDSANNDFLLDYGPGAAVFEAVRFAGMATRLWYESADAVAAQLDTVRDGDRGRGIGLWLQAWTGEQESDGTQSFDGGTFDVSFEQDFQGIQGGLDYQTGAVAVGITAGTGRSDAVFAATGNPVDMEVSNIGAYVQGRSGLLFFNALAKFDWAELEIAPGAGLGASFDADLFGIQANAGVRLGFGSVFAEPSVGLSWVQSDVEAFASGPATVGPGDGESLRARAGLRVGARLPLGGGALLPFVAVNAYEELEGRSSSDFTLGETLRLFDEPPGTRGQAAAGIGFVAGSFEAFVRGDMDFSGGSDSKSVRVGARLRF